MWPVQARSEFTMENDYINRCIGWLVAARIADAKCIVVTRVCVSIRLSAAACLHYCTDPDVT